VRLLVSVDRSVKIWDTTRKLLHSAPNTTEVPRSATYQFQSANARNVLQLSAGAVPLEPTSARPFGPGRIARPKVQWTAEDRARHQTIRDKFRDWHPSPEELIASGEGATFDLQGEYRELQPFVEEIKRVREAAGLTLADVSRRCGIDQPALSRLETGHNKNPTLDTLWRYAAAVGRRLVLVTEAIRDTRPAGIKAKRIRSTRAE
jgi:hypothetical protein